MDPIRAARFCLVQEGNEHQPVGRAWLSQGAWKWLTESGDYAILPSQ